MVCRRVARISEASASSGKDARRRRTRSVRRGGGRSQGRRGLRRDAIIIWATDHYPLVMTPCRSMYTTWDVNGHRHTVATNPTIGTTVEMVSPVATSNP